MSLNESMNVPSKVVKAIANASKKTGANLDYLFKTALRESSFNPKAKASTSSASGLFQFIEQTWLQTVKEAGPGHGLGNIAKHITQNGAGRFDVSSPKMKQKILDLRYDAETASVMAGAFTKKNASILQGATGRKPSDGELYMAHFLGAEGAAKLISLAQNAPNASAKDTFPAAAAANRPIFYNKNGTARSAQEVYAALASKHDGATTGAPAPAKNPSKGLLAAAREALQGELAPTTGGPASFFGLRSGSEQGAAASPQAARFFGSAGPSSASPELAKGFASEPGGLFAVSKSDAVTANLRLEAEEALFSWLRGSENGTIGKPLNLTDLANAQRAYTPDPLKPKGS